MTRIYILVAIFIFIFSSNCFAEWRKHPPSQEEETTEEYFAKTDREFLLPEEKTKNGFNINAIDKNINSVVRLRHNSNKVDFKVSLLIPISKNSGKVVLLLLDEDRFLVESVPVSRVCKEYTGDSFGQFSMNWENFCRIKYYDFRFFLDPQK